MAEHLRESQLSPILTTAFAENPLTAAIIERYMHDTVLSVAEKETVFWKLGRHVKVPRGNSKTISFERFERLVPPRRPAQEGIPPPGVVMRVNKVVAIAEQWINLVTLTDVVELTVRHEPMQRALELIGLDAAMTVDREIQRVLRSGTNVFFPNNRTDRSQLLASDFPNTPMLRRMIAQLSQDGAPAFEGRRYVGVVDPYHSADIQADPTFVGAAMYSNLTALQEAEIGIWMRARWMESNNMPTFTQDAAVNPAGAAAAAPDAGETALADDDYDVLLLGLDVNGFETTWSATTTGVTTAGGQVIVVTTPALPGGIEAFNVYVSKGPGSTDYRLQAEDVAGSVAIAINGGGTHTGGGAVSSHLYTGAGMLAGLTPPAGVNVHTFFLFGKEYYSCTELAAIQVFKSGAGAVKIVDPADQIRQIAWKAFFKGVITNELFGARGEADSDFDGN